MDSPIPCTPDRPGRNSVWTPPRRANVPGDPQGPRTRPAPRCIGTLDGVRSAFWQSYRHLFPPHSLAAQTANGSIVISWSVLDDPHATYPYAAPVMLRIEEGLLDLMEHADARQRGRIAEKHEPTLREGLRGYDPFAKVPNARVVVLG